MSPQRLVLLAVLCGAIVLQALIATGLAGLGWQGIENGGVRIAAETPQATAIANYGVNGVSVSDAVIIEAPSPERGEVLPPVRLAPVAPVQSDGEASGFPAEVVEMG